MTTKPWDVKEMTVDYSPFSICQKLKHGKLDVQDNAYETLVLAYNKELDVLVSANFIIKSNVKKERSPPYSEDVVANSKEETTNMEDSTLMATPQSTIGSNELNEPPMEPSSAQYVKKRVWGRI